MEFRRTAGDTFRFQDVYKRLSAALADLVVGGDGDEDGALTRSPTITPCKQQETDDQAPIATTTSTTTEDHEEELLSDQAVMI